MDFNCLGYVDSYILIEWMFDYDEIKIHQTTN